MLRVTTRTYSDPTKRTYSYPTKRMYSYTTNLYPLVYESLKQDTRIDTMTEIANITKPPVALGVDRPAASDSARDVKVRAAAGRQSDSPEQPNALSKLARVLAPDDPPAANVPRGFNLNIEV